MGVVVFFIFPVRAILGVLYWPNLGGIYRFPGFANSFSFTVRSFGHMTGGRVGRRGYTPCTKKINKECIFASYICIKVHLTTSEEEERGLRTFQGMYEN